jgi:hypothetical protein
MVDSVLMCNEHKLTNMVNVTSSDVSMIVALKNALIWGQRVGRFCGEHS